MDFSGVTEVKIPQGNVTKITETSGGRVLWERFPVEVKAHWEIMEFINNVAQNNYYDKVVDVVDTGDGVEFFCLGNEGTSTFDLTKPRPARRFHVKKDGSYGDVYTLWRGTKLQSDDIAKMSYQQLSEDEQNAQADPLPSTIARYWGGELYSADIDPETKIWCVACKAVYATNSLNTIKWKDHNAGAQLNMCCWSPKLKKFCLTNGADAALVDIDGNVTATNNTDALNSDGLVSHTSSILWSDYLGKFVMTTGHSTYMMTTYSKVRESSDGLHWSNVDLTFSGGITDQLQTANQRRKLGGFCWMGNIGKFVMVAAGNDGYYYIYTSTNIKNWTHVATLDDMYGGSHSFLELSLTYSPKKQVLLLVGLKTSYLTRDLQTWTKVPFASGMTSSILYGIRKWARWSNSFNAFIRLYRNVSKPVAKLVIDN